MATPVPTIAAPAPMSATFGSETSQLLKIATPQNGSSLRFVWFAPKMASEPPTIVRVRPPVHKRWRDFEAVCAAVLHRRVPQSIAQRPGVREHRQH